MSQEIELKLELTADAAQQLRTLPLFADAEKIGAIATLDNTYYDTPALALRDAGIGLRTRRKGSTWLQTVKCEAPSSGGLSARPEWEQPFDGSFSYAAIDDEKTRKRLEKHANAIEPVFTTRFKRETRRIVRGNASILLMLDEGEIIAGERHEPLCELELELEQGRASDLLTLAREFATLVPLLPSDASKAERGYRLQAGKEPRPLRAEPSPVRAEQSPIEAFRALAQSCLRQWQANAIGAAHSDDPEFVHQLRVALRRLRSLIKLFAPTLPATFVQDWSEQLKEHANHFGDTRDLDVFEEELVKPIKPASGDEERALEHLHDVVSEARTRAREDARRNLSPTEQGQLLLDFNAALHELESNPLIDSANLTLFARLQLDQLRKGVRRRYNKALSLVPERLHAMRISLKKLRYGLEFFAPLYADRTLDRYTRDLARAQTALGFINDLDVARGRLAGWAGKDLRLHFAHGLVCGWHGPRYHRLSRRSLVMLKPLLWEPAPWDAAD